MGLLRWFCGWPQKEETEKSEEDEFDICEQCGHDYRPKEKDGLGSKFVDINQTYPKTLGIDTKKLPGTLLGFHSLVQHYTAVCRDCGDVNETQVTVELRVVYTTGEEIGTMLYDVAVNLGE